MKDRSSYQISIILHFIRGPNRKVLTSTRSKHYANRTQKTKMESSPVVDTHASALVQGQQTCLRVLATCNFTRRNNVCGVFLPRHYHKCHFFHENADLLIVLAVSAAQVRREVAPDRAQPQRLVADHAQQSAHGARRQLADDEGVIGQQALY